MIESRRVMKVVVVALGLLLAAGPLAGRADVGVKAGNVVAKTGSSGLFPVYRPPMRGAPERRIGGGTRGDGEVAAVLQALAPAHAGLTVAEQPNLYWYISTPSTVRLQLTLIDEQGIEPLLEIEMREPVARGIHALSLAEHGIRLQPDTEYQWFVALIPDASQRSQDLLAGAVIRRVAAPSGLAQALAKAGKDGTAFVYAEHGLWYDALDALSVRIHRHPHDAELRAQRAALLEQVGMEDAAAFDRQAGK